LNAHKLQSLCHGDATLDFGAGMSDPDVPDVYLRDFTNAYQLWIEVGQPEDKPIIKACGKSSFVEVYTFSHSAALWWKGMETKLTRARNLTVWQIPNTASQALAAMAQRSMQLQATVQEGQLMLSDGANTVNVEPVRLR
jgi:uncharacterized protein YaeQ